jgi:DNA-binding NtrC family response regulator
VSHALTALPCAHTVTTAVASEHEIARRRPDLVVVAAGAHDARVAVDCLQRLRRTFSYARFLFLTDSGSEDLAVAAFMAGAERYVREPWSVDALQAAARALLPEQESPDALRGGERLVGRSPAMVALRAQLARIAPTTSNVMILGETGTGKELVAELLHFNGPRASRPFVCLNTAAIPDTLLENELFGHERGAFTVASDAQAVTLADANA